MPICSSFHALSNDMLCLAKKKSVFGRKPWTIVRRFDQISFRLHNSLLEGATELKFAAFCSSFHALSDNMLSDQNRNCQFLAENHGL